MRSSLSLLGITIGIFAIISVFTLVDTLERNLQESVKALGEDVVFVQKWPWGPDDGGEFEWWEYIKRPQPRIEEFEKLQDRLPAGTPMAFMGQGSKSIHHESSTVDRISIRAVTFGFAGVREVDLAKGRYFSPHECRSGRNVVVVGAGIEENLFPKGNALGRDVRIGGRKTRVIGVIEKEGQSLIGFSMDNTVLVPYQYGTKVLPLEELERSILVSSKGKMSQDALKAEVRGGMRSIRRTSPKRDDSFALNSPSLVSENLNELFGRVDIAGAIIGLFSILVGGFSIANIMFVSVKERTPWIGVQKALGAKQSSILSQFLFESVFLCLIGGGIGLLLVFLIGLPVGALIGTPILLSFKNVMLGLGVSFLIGVLSGLFPAFLAARMDPVQAIRS